MHKKRCKDCNVPPAQKSHRNPVSEFGKTLSDSSDFEFVDRSVGKVLNFKDSFRIYNLSVSRSVNHIPSMARPKSIHFSYDRRMP
jgi:hypothetical protein